MYKTIVKHNNLGAHSTTVRSSKKKYPEPRFENVDRLSDESNFIRFLNKSTFSIRQQ